MRVGLTSSHTQKPAQGGLENVSTYYIDEYLHKSNPHSHPTLVPLKASMKSSSHVSAALAVMSSMTTGIVV